jgi:uncharacterized protein YndB with AHSA1/START domain
MKPFKQSFKTPAAPQEAYAAAATAAGLQAWWCKNCDIASSPGGQHHLRFDKQGTLVNMHFVVDELVPNERVSWTCTKNDNPVWVGSKLTWEVSPSGDGAEVSFSHDGFAAGGPPYEATMQGWVMFMNSLQAHLSGGKGSPW